MHKSLGVMAAPCLTLLPPAWYGSCGKLYRCCLPCSTSLDKDGIVLSQLQEAAGLSQLVVVAVPPDDEILRLTGGRIVDIAKYYEDNGVICYRPTWIEKYSEENHELLDGLADTVVSHLQRGDTVAVHCHSGFGRGGVVLAAVLQRGGFKDAVSDVIESLQSIDQQFLSAAKANAWAKKHIERGSQ